MGISSGLVSRISTNSTAVKTDVPRNLQNPQHDVWLTQLSSLSSTLVGRSLKTATRTPKFVVEKNIFVWPKPLPNAHAPIYEPNKWNKVLKSANCYVYAVNDYNPNYNITSTTMASYRGPGHIYPYNPHQQTTQVIEIYEPFGTSDKDFNKFVAAQILGAIADGLRPTGSAIEAAPGTYKVALFARRARKPVHDGNAMGFHWVRQDRSGFWSHKPGSTRVTDRDFNGRRIQRPDSASMGNYIFISYFDVPRNGLKLRLDRE
jgi:hypothetical protein